MRTGLHARAVAGAVPVAAIRPTVAPPEPPRRLLAARPVTLLSGGVRLRPSRAVTGPRPADDPAGPRWRPVPAAPSRPGLSALDRLRQGVALTPGWPLRYLLLGYPLWWALGLGTFIFPILALPMIVSLWRHRPLRFPPAFALWALSLLWLFVSLAMFGSSPPGTHASSTNGRLVSIAFEIVMSFVVTVVLLYVGNLPESEASQGAIARWLGTFFLTVLAGGYLGLVLPRLSFRSPLEMLLPARLANDSYVQALVHPVASQVQTVLGVAAGRPAAPFGYTNTWGNMISILVVWFVATRVMPARGWRRIGYGVVAALASVPVVLSLNRGLWIGLIFTLVWLALRQVSFGRVGVLLAGLGVALVAAAAFATTPLYSVVSARLENGDSNSIRAFVARQSIKAIEYSPILGYGGTRHTNGSSSSIAVGPTPNCGNCGDVATGSTGQLWAIMFNHGLGGVLFYYGFFAMIVVIFWRQRGRIAEAALVTVVLTFVYMFFYSDVLIAPSLTMIAVGLLWRGRHSEPVRTPGRRRRVGGRRSSP